jgi:hypothetical protein
MFIPKERRFDLGPIRRLSDRLASLEPRRTKKIIDRATIGVQRRWKVDAPKLIAAEILNITPSRLRDYLGTKVSTLDGFAAVTLTGLRKRIPLHLFSGARYAGPKSPGAVVQVWRDSPPKVYPRTFAIKGRGVAGGIFQRAPEFLAFTTEGDYMLHGRLPLVQRKGPEVWRAVSEGKHGDVRPQLIETARATFRAEIERLIKVKD